MQNINRELLSDFVCTSLYSTLLIQQMVLFIKILIVAFTVRFPQGNELLTAECPVEYVSIALKLLKKKQNTIYFDFTK